MEELVYTENGIKIYGYKNTGINGFFISLFVKAGSMYEGEGERGITHFLEHALVRNVNKIMDMRLYSELDRRGLEFNASTFAEMVQFYVFGASKNFSLGADIISRLFEPIILDKAETDIERRRIKAEIRENDDKSSMSTFAMETLYRATSLMYSITGTRGDVDKIGARRLEEYRSKIFEADNLFLYVTGNYTNEDIAYLSHLVGRAQLAREKISPPRDNTAPVPHNFGKRGAEVAVKNSDYTMVRFNFDIDMSIVSSPVCDLVYDNLFSGYNSPFFIKMSEEGGMVYDISGAIERYTNIGSLYFSFELKEKDIYEAVKLSVELINSFKLFPPSEIIKAPYTDNAPLLLDDAREMNFTFAYDSHIMGLGYRDIEERSAAYEKITREDLRQAACQIFTSDNLTLTVKGNKKRIDAKRLSDICRELDI